MHFLVKRIKRVLCPILVMFLLLYMGTILAQAAAGTVYTCKINPSYAHPVTGEIEDAGGSSSTATGQGMVEGALGSSGILEVTDSGEYYLTIRCLISCVRITVLAVCGLSFGPTAVLTGLCLFGRCTAGRRICG